MSLQEWGPHNGDQELLSNVLHQVTIYKTHDSKANPAAMNKTITIIDSKRLTSVCFTAKFVVDHNHIS